LHEAAEFVERCGTFSSEKSSTVGTRYAFAFLVVKAAALFASVLTPNAKFGIIVYPSKFVVTVFSQSNLFAAASGFACGCPSLFPSFLQE
jgi:hypothetical protein